eukprot:2672033-Alexandrium_andersonii.AAC.1
MAAWLSASTQGRSTHGCEGGGSSTPSQPQGTEMLTYSGSSVVGAHMPMATTEQTVAARKSDSLHRRLSCGGAANAAHPPKCCTSTGS